MLKLLRYAKKYIIPAIMSPVLMIGEVVLELMIPLVTTNDIHYTYAEDEKPHDILLCIQTGKKLADEDRMRYDAIPSVIYTNPEVAAVGETTESAKAKGYNVEIRTLPLS